MNMKRMLSLFLSLLILLSCCWAIPVGAVEIDREIYNAEMKAQYGDIDFSDPQFISDETFFGVWDGVQWTKVPYFLYERYPGLAAVEEAAKEGNYEACKVRLLEYYREKYASFNISLGVSKNVSEKARVQYEAGFNNFFPNYMQSISAQTYFTMEDSWVTADILSDVNGKASTANKVLKLQLVAAEKDGYMAEVHTRESEFKPYVRVLVNGAYRNYVASYDTYVCGLEPDAVQGAKTSMFVEESVSSIGSKSSAKDEYCKTSFLQFDFNDLTANDQISEAKLYLHGRMYESDTPGGVRKPDTTKKVYVMPFSRGDTILNEMGLTYQIYKTYTIDYTLWDGEPSPSYQRDADGKKIYSYVTMMTPYLDMFVQGYAATGEEDFAWHAMRVIMGIIREKGDYEWGQTDGWTGHTFYVGQMCYTLPQYLYYFIQSEYMTPDIFTAIMKHLWDAAKFQVEMWSYDEEANNVGLYATQGLIALGMFYPEFREAQEPLKGLKNLNQKGSMQGGWIEVSKYRYDYKAKDDIREDGSSVEISKEYAAEILVNLFQPISYGKMLGIDPADYYTDEMIALMEKGALDILSHTNPRFGDWQYADCGSYYGSAYGSRLKLINDLVDNPYIQYFVSNRKYGKQPEYLTYIGDTAGKVTFRNSWDENAVAGHMEASSGQGTHGHTDDLSLTMAAYGQYLLVDPMMGNYETHEQNEAWLSSTRGHNTIEINNTVAKGGKTYSEVPALNRYVVDGVLQGPDFFEEDEIIKYPNAKANKISDLNPDNREVNKIYDFVRGETFGYTDHNAMDGDYQVIRDVLFMHKGYFVVTDYINPEKQEAVNTYKQLWHFMNDANITVDEATDTIETNFNGKGNVIIATVDSNEETKPEIKDGIYALWKNNFVSAKYALYEKEQAGTTTFNTLLYAVPLQKKSNIYTKELTLDVAKDKANAFEAQIEDRQSKAMTTVNFYNLFDDSIKENRDFGTYTTDGVLALSEESDNGYSAAVLRKGTQLKDKLRDTYLVYATEEVQDLGVEWKGTVIELSSAHTEGADKLDLSKVTIAAQDEVSEVRYNGQEISFKQQGKYVYFGLNPLIEDNTQLGGAENEDNGTNDQPIHGGGDHYGSGIVGGGSVGGGSIGGGSVGGGTAGGGTAGGGITAENDKTFGDVSGHWAEEYIKEASKTGIVKGDEWGNFNPDASITRAELITMAVRSLGEKETAYDGTFGDVESGAWYASFVARALKEALISKDNTFRPNDAVTREEMCKILVCVAMKLGTVPPEESVMTEFADGEEIAFWARDYVDLAVGLGLMNGMDDYNFLPKATATRAQVVTVIQRILSSVQ